jgi:hypothetical protein
MRFLGFLIYSVITMNTVFSVVKILFPFTCSSLFCKRCVFIHLLRLSLLCLLLVCWVRENFYGGPGHIFPVWDSAVWSAGPIQFFSGTFLERMAGLYRFSFFLAPL